MNVRIARDNTHTSTGDIGIAAGDQKNKDVVLGTALMMMMGKPAKGEMGWLDML